MVDDPVLLSACQDGDWCRVLVSLPRFNDPYGAEKSSAPILGVARVPTQRRKQWQM